MPAKPDMHLMQCLEVWGGNQAVDSGVIMAGVDAWLFSQPYQGSDRGGDVHFVSSCATGRLTRMLVADVSGHGSAVAATATALRRVMRRYMNHIDQRKFVGVLNAEFSALAKAGTFATTVAATYYAPTRELAICTAGHPPPLRYSLSKRAWSALSESDSKSSSELANIPLGILDLSDYEQQKLKLGVGDLVLLYTDSLIESRGADGRLLGVAGLLEIAQSIDVSDPGEFLEKLLNAMRGLHPTNLTTDDVTALLFRPNSLAPRVPIGTRLRAQWIMLRALAKYVVKRKEPMPWPEMSVANIGGAFSDRLAKATGGSKNEENASV
jgi:sigma-B regulation protein RsbU (phosphoserine phosphatase)